jgi:hypothetical protein
MYPSRTQEYPTQDATSQFHFHALTCSLHPRLQKPGDIIYHSAPFSADATLPLPLPQTISLYLLTP